MPELRIVDDTLWNLVQTRRQAGQNLTERIELTPLPKRGHVSLALRPRTTALVALALSDKWQFDRSVHGGAR